MPGPSTEQLWSQLWSARTLLKFFCDEMLPWFAANKPDVFSSFLERRKVYTPPVTPRPHTAPSCPPPSRRALTRRPHTAETT
jgi:hypothetical protein